MGGYKMPRKAKQQLILTPDNIQSQIDEYEQLTRIDFESVKGYTEIYKRFSPQRILECIKDFAEFTSEYTRSRGKIESDDQFMFLFLHIVKHFTSICPTFPSDFVEKLSFLHNLSKHPCIFEMKDKFDPKEVAKVYTTMFKQFEEYQKLMEHDADMKRRLNEEINKLDNADAIRAIMLGDQNAIVQ